MHNRYLARVVVFSALTGLAAGCGGSSYSASVSTTGLATSRSGNPAAAATSAPLFAAIVEPFDRGHAARIRQAAADCATQLDTLAIVRCYQIKTENTDARIDAVQQGLYNGAPPVVQAGIVAQDRAWLAARAPVCRAAFAAGGNPDTVAKISIAACLLAESTARLDAVKNITPPMARLKSTDSTNPAHLSWYTTPEGSRIAEIDTQGDRTGGAVISWVIIGGSEGFVINAKQFFYADGPFTDHGIIQGPNPAYHKVPTGVMYQFGVDYSRLSQDPNARRRAGGYVYVPGAAVAIWQ